MLRLFTFCALVAFVFAAPTGEDATAEITQFENESDGKGNYKFSFETSNGMIRQESGTVKNEGQPNQYIYVEGFISYSDAEGNIKNFRYVAGENGYEILPPIKQGVLFSLPSHAVATLLG